MFFTIRCYIKHNVTIVKKKIVTNCQEKFVFSFGYRIIFIALSEEY